MCWAVPGTFEVTLGFGVLDSLVRDLECCNEVASSKNAVGSVTQQRHNSYDK